MIADINTLRNISSNAIREAAGEKTRINPYNSYSDLLGRGISVENYPLDDEPNMFQTMLDSAVRNLSVTNGYLSDAENEESRWALGETDNTHDLSVALQKASTALQYTVAVRDRLLAAYREIMQMQI